MKPVVSIVVATYQRKESLYNALESLAQQDYEPVEIVLVDDNDHPQWNQIVRGIVSDFQTKHSHIPLRHIENHPNQGSARARNTGVNGASGSYITFLDDDDVYLPEKVTRQLNFMLQGDLDYSVTDLMLYDHLGKLRDSRIRDYITSNDADALLRYHLKYHITGTDTMMFRKDYFLQIGGFAPINVGDEYYLMHRAIDGGGKFGYLPGCDVKAYIHTGDGGLSSGEGKIQGENQLYEYKKAYFPKLKKEDRRYIKTRHFMVLAYAHLRKRQYLKCGWNMLNAMAASPVDLLKLAVKR